MTGKPLVENSREAHDAFRFCPECGFVGRTTYDYLNYGGQNVDPLCPTFLVSTSA